MKEKNLLEEICNKLNEVGMTELDSSDVLSVKEVPFTIRSESINSLRWLPEENLEKIAAIDFLDYEDCESFKDACEKWSKLGYLKFEPYIINADGNPSLVLEYNRFLHMFRGDHFQISYTEYEDGVASMSPYDTSYILKESAHQEYWSNSKLFFMCLYANMIDVGFQNENFVKLFNNNKELVDEFFKTSMRYWGFDFGYDYRTIDEFIFYHDGTLLNKHGSCVYEINLKEGCACRFRIENGTIAIEYAPNEYGQCSRLVMLAIPDPVEGIGVDVKDTNDELRNEFYDFFPNSGFRIWEKMLLLMMLKFVGISLNYLGIRTVRKIGYIRASERMSDVIQCRGLSDITNYIGQE